MSDIVIRAENLGKKYRIGHQRGEAERYTALRDVLARSARGFARSARDMFRGNDLVAGEEIEDFWALKDVSFEIKRGDVVGIIGRNGAGKSTLLKILSRITEPSTGRVEIKGRVASLLEVGTGFHPELTGRENIFLNGAILGMSRAEIRRKFDEIVAFAEVEKFLDTPVKRYSSGMYVRLAFAVAAHLEPEILVVDEVLAVGDAEFQKKCLGKMGEVSQAGRSILFVSHDLTSVRKLCSRGILLERGTVKALGDTETLLRAYQSYQPLAQSRTKQDRPKSLVEVSRFSVSPSSLSGSGPVQFEIDVQALVGIRLVLNIFVADELGKPVGAVSIGGMGSVSLLPIQVGMNRVKTVVNFPRLAKGCYNFDVELANREKITLSRVDRVASILSMPQPNEGEAETLETGWQFGSVWFEHVLLSVDGPNVCETK